GGGAGGGRGGGRGGVGGPRRRPGRRGGQGGGGGVRGGALPLPPRGGPDGRGGLAIDVGFRPRRPRDRAAGLLLAQRGPRQGAAVRRLLTRRDRPAALDVVRARAAAAGRGARPRSGGRQRDPGPNGADGRRGAQPQPDRHAHAAAGPPAVADRLRRPVVRRVAAGRRRPR